MAGAISHLNGRPSLSTVSRSSKRPSSSLCYRPMAVRMSQSQSYWTSIEAEIESHLRKAIPIRPPESVFEPMHYLSFAAPSTKAPALCIAACELVGGDRDQAAMAAAAAIHLMHAAAYAHEHLPLTDRPKPRAPIQHKFDPNIELLTGDGIVPFGLELLAGAVDPALNNSDRILRVIIEITRAVGSQGMVDGQFREMEHLQLGSDSESNELGLIEDVSKKKEGELYACGAACGAILGGATEGEIEKLRNYGLYVGIIQGMQYGIGRNKKGLEEIVEEFRVKAIQELEGFNSKDIGPISSLLGPSLISV